MATKQIPQIPGLDAVVQFLAMLGDPVKYKQLADSLDAIRKDANERYRAMGIKGDVDAMLASAKVKEKRANEKLAKANAEYEFILQKAKDEAEEMIHAARLRSDQTIKNSEIKLKEASQRESDARSLKVQLEQDREKVLEEIKSLKCSQEKANSLCNEYQLKLESIQSALNAAKGKL